MPWTRNELLILLNLYHKLSFGHFHARHPAVISVAAQLGRTSGSVAMKLSNLASLDPAMHLRGIAGLRGASRLDRTVWKEFHENLEEAVPASEEAFRNLFNARDDDEVSVLPKEGICVIARPPQGSTAVYANVKVRRGQDYFRNAVLNNFQGRCGVTGISIKELLIASHILPWNTHPKERLNVRNGLCLSRLHDAAFDQGLITFDNDLKLVLSKTIREILDNKAASDCFGAYEGHPLDLPDDASLPESDFLTFHRNTIFRL
jgi:putative restriction endonuclease